MNKKNAQAWVNDLRHGGHLQCTGQLSIIEEDGQRSYCCLGRVCELAGLSPNDETPMSKFYNGHAGDLPSKAERWLGSDNPDPELHIPPKLRAKTKGRDRTTATMLNDEYELTFPEIADCISYTLRYHNA